MAKKRVSFGTSVSRAIVDDHIPNATRTGLTKALFEGGAVSDYVLEEMVNSIGIRAERMYTYGRDHYTHGLPSGQFTVAAEAIEDVVGTVLLGIEGTAATIDYLHHGPPNSLHIGWVKLVEVHGYNPATNQLAGLTAIKGTPVYLDDMVVVVPEALLPVTEARSMQQWGIAAKAGFTPERTVGTAETRAMIQPSLVRVDPDATVEHLRVTYVWMTSSGLQRDSLDMLTSSFDDAADYFHVRYQVGAVSKYWMYRDGAGTYPTLDSLFDHNPLPSGSFFPFAYFRYNRVSEIDNKTAPAYLTSKKLVKYLGIDYDEMAEAIDANPDIDDVEQAMLIMAVPAVTSDPLERRYLWDFFNQVFLASSPDFRYRSEEEAAQYALSLEQTGLKSPGIVIQDARFKMSLDNRGIYKRRKAGSIGPVGACSSSVSTQTLSYKVIVDADNPYETDVGFDIVSNFYQKQISTNYYDEIQVVSLRTLFHILGSYTSIGDGDSALLLIPLDRSITGDYSIPDREVLYSRSLHFVFNSLVYTKVEWYQTALFQFVVLVVALVITAWTWGADGGTALAAALAAGNYAAAAYIVLVAIVKILVVKAVFKLFVKELGIEFAFILAIVAAALGMVDAFNAGSVAGAPFAAELLALSSGITTGIGAQLKDDMQDLLAEASQFSAEQKEQLKLLETAQDLLENNTFLSPFVIFGEKPEDFYNRTIHSGNIGVVGISAISSYVDQALQLPELIDTIGGFEYVSL